MINQQVQVTAWYHQVTSHYLSQCWPSSGTSYGVTMPQWVKKMSLYIYQIQWGRICPETISEESFGVWSLIHCGLVVPYGIIEFVNIGSGNDLLLDSTKPLPEAMWTNQLCHSPDKKNHKKCLILICVWKFNYWFKITPTSPRVQWVKWIAVFWLNNRAPG